MLQIGEYGHLYEAIHFFVVYEGMETQSALPGHLALVVFDHRFFFVSPDFFSKWSVCPAELSRRSRFIRFKLGLGARSQFLKYSGLCSVPFVVSIKSRQPVSLIQDGKNPMLDILDSTVISNLLVSFAFTTISQCSFYQRYHPAPTGNSRKTEQCTKHAF